MVKGKSTPKGGRPPYTPELNDNILAQRMAAHGYTKKSIARALEIPEDKLYAIINRDDKFRESIKKGVINHCLNIEDKFLEGEITPAQYIYWSKTKWKNFYPQEDKAPTLEPINITFSQDNTKATIKKAND